MIATALSQFDNKSPEQQDNRSLNKDRLLTEDSSTAFAMQSTWPVRDSKKCWPHPNREWITEHNSFSIVSLVKKNTLIRE